jgi:RadC-like JAB domain
MHVLLKSEPDSSSRTGTAYRAYYHADGAALQALHVGGETELEARHRVLTLYPTAQIEVEEPCCEACKHNKPCESGCKENPIHAHHILALASNVVGMMSEPLLAVYDGQTEEVFGCGECGCDKESSSSPKTLRFEKLNRNPLSLETTKEIELSKELQALYSKGGACPECLPWVRIQTDPQAFKQALQNARKLGPIKSSKDFYKLVKPYLLQQHQEVFIVLLLDVHNQVLGISELSRGARDRVMVPVPDVLRLPLVDGATGFVVAHNHPSGKIKPSQADKEVTKALKQGADAVNVLFIDHIIVGADGYYSFNDHNQV